METLQKSHNVFTHPVSRPLLALLTCFLWGSAFPAIKIGYELFQLEDTGSKILFAGYRFFLAGLFTFIAASVLEGRIVTVKKASWPAIVLQGVLQTAIQYFCFYIGLSYTTGAKASVINGSNAFFSILAAHFMTKDEKVNLRKILGCIIGFIGIIVVNMRAGQLLGDFKFLGEGMVLLCSISYGISAVTLKRISNRETPGAITTYQLFVGGLMLMAAGFVMGGSIHGFTLLSTLLLIYLAAVSTVTFCIWASLLKYNPVGKIAIFGFSIPIFGVLLSALFLHENVLVWTNFAALLLVSIGIVIVNRQPESLK